MNADVEAKRNADLKSEISEGRTRNYTPWSPWQRSFPNEQVKELPEIDSNREALRTFRMKPEGVKPIQDLGLYLVRFTWIGLGISFAVVCWKEFQKEASEGVDSIYLGVNAVFMGTLGAVVSFLQRHFINRWADLARTLEILVGHDVVIKRQKDHPEIMLRRDEVTHIYELGQGGMMLRGNHRYKQIMILSGLDGYEELRSLLLSWGKPVSAGQQRLFWVLLLIGGFAPMLAHFAPHFVPTSVGYGLSAASFLFAFVEWQRSPHVDKSSRYFSWAFLLLALWMALKALQS